VSIETLKYKNSQNGTLTTKKKTVATSRLQKRRLQFHLGVDAHITILREDDPLAI
jgi:hypothetical protein